MKICKREGCDSTDLATRSAICKEHHREYVRAHYQSNKQYYVDKAARRNEAVKQRVRALKEVPCEDCKQSFPYYVMDFDHMEDKSFTMALAWQKPWSEILKEAAKCEIVCANCHRVRTHNRTREESSMGDKLS